MTRPVSLKQVADLAGVAKSTASYALNDSPLIKENTRKKVRAAAEKLGYHNDPAIARALSNSRAGKRTKPGESIIAYVTNTHSGANEKLFEASRTRAEELGLKVERFYFDYEGYPRAERTFQIIAARGIRGVIIGPLIQNKDNLPVEWSRFACVHIGSSLLNPHLHSVQKDLVLETRDAIAYLEQLGCKRIGFIINPDSDARKGSPILSEALIYRYRILDTNKADSGGIRDVMLRSKELNKTMLHEWAKNYKPDGLVIDGTGHDFNKHVSALDPIEKVTLYKRPQDNHIAGFAPDYRLIGRTAIGILANELAKRAYGIPKVPERSLFKTELSLPEQTG